MAYMNHDLYFEAAQAEETIATLEAKYRIAPLPPAQVVGKKVSQVLHFSDVLLISFTDGTYIGVRPDSHDDGLDYAHATTAQLAALGLVSGADIAAFNEASAKVAAHKQDTTSNIQFNQLLRTLGKEKLQSMLDKSK